VKKAGLKRGYHYSTAMNKSVLKIMEGGSGWVPPLMIKTVAMSWVKPAYKRKKGKEHVHSIMQLKDN